MDQIYHSSLNWMGYQALKELLERYGFGVSPSESEDDLREAVRANLMDGTIPKSEIDTSIVPERANRH